MLFHFWGVRGSIPTPVTPEQIQNKIAAAISRISQKDIESEDAKTRFLASLPEWIFGTVGGNTACVEVRTKEDKVFLLDCGSGLRSYAKNGRPAADGHYNILMSHFHWDHIQGLPFFDATFNPNCRFDVYSAFPDAEKYFAEQSRPPYFPINGSWQNVKDRFTFHLIEEDIPFEVDGVTIAAHKMNHPGDSYSFRIDEDGKSLVYATDVELQNTDFLRNIERNLFFDDADAIIIDTQYTSTEAVQKQSWGHSSFALAVDFAHTWNAKNLYFFHHEPTYDDQKLYKMLQSANWYASYRDNCKVKIHIAIEGQEVEL